MVNVQFEKPQGPALLPGTPLECWCGEYIYGMCAPLHWHFFSELIYVNEGSQDVTAGNRIEHLRTGDLIYINPRQIHLAYSGDRRTTQLTVLKFDPVLLLPSRKNKAEEESLAPFLGQEPTQCLVFEAGGLPAEVPALLEQLVQLVRLRPQGCEFSARALVCLLIARLSGALGGLAGRAVSGEPLEQRELERFRTVLQTIEAHYAEPLSAAGLAALCSLSYSNFVLKFRRLTGQTPVDYINRVRISHAQQLLLTGSSVGETAAACGFCDAAYFSRLFARYSGQPPRVFRQNNASVPHRPKTGSDG